MGQLQRTQLFCIKGKLDIHMIKKEKEK